MNSFEIQFIHGNVIYYTIFDFNGVDMRIYQPEKVIFTEAARQNNSSTGSERLQVADHPRLEVFRCLHCYCFVHPFVQFVHPMNKLICAILVHIRHGLFSIAQVWDSEQNEPRRASRPALGFSTRYMYGSNPPALSQHWDLTWWKFDHYSFQISNNKALVRLRE